MNLLSIDTSSTSGSVAVMKNNKIKYINYQDIKITHSERLMPQIEDSLEKCKIDISAIDGVLIANGPGSFTGLRIGLATAKSICFANKIPLIPISTLKMWAANIMGCDKNILSILDARMDEVYIAVYNSDLETIIEPLNCKPDSIKKLINFPVAIIGDGYEKYKNIIETLNLDYSIPPMHLNQGLADSLFSIFFKEKIKLEYDLKTMSKLQPFYLRKSQAEMKREKKLT